MAMNKKEQAEFDKLQRQLQTAYALHWTTEVLPDVPPPSNGTFGMTTGWLFNTYSNRVAPACSTSINHSFGHNDKTDSQGSRALYSTKVLALRALRYSLEKQYADALASVDARIEAEVRYESINKPLPDDSVSSENL